MGDPTFHISEQGPTPVAPYSHAVEVEGWIHLTGLLPNHPDDDSRPLPEGIEAQTARTMENLKIVLGELGLGLEHVISARIFLTDFESDYEPMNQVYLNYFPEDRRPARTCIGVTALARKAKVEIDMVARRLQVRT